jgi:hypothetical protein
VSGKIAAKGEVDYYSFEVRKDETLLFKISSNKVGKEDKFDVAELALYERLPEPGLILRVPHV